MTDKFTAQHRFLLAAWYEVYRSPIVVQRLYRQRFGRNVSIPSATSIKAMHKKASVHGTLEDLLRSGRPATSHTPENIDLVAETFCSNPRTFTRRASLELGIPRSTVVRIVHEQKLHPYKLRQFHELSAEDLAERQRFAEDFGQVRYVRLFSLFWFNVSFCFNKLWMRIPSFSMRFCGRTKRIFTSMEKLIDITVDIGALRIPVLSAQCRYTRQRWWSGAVCGAVVSSARFSSRGT